jgi:hypothetical protein
VIILSFIKDAILKASSVMDCQAKQVSNNESSTIRKHIEEKYAATHGQSPLWERLEGDLSKYDPDGWRKIGEFPYDDKVTLFFDKNNETTMFSVNSCKEVVSILSECPGFVFYITDAKCSFLLCHNDHDYLIGAGVAKNWVGDM